MITQEVYMENYDVYQDISSRTGGDIYIGVVGPVRTGKSTFIRRFMETLVIPSASASERAVMIDELPQAAAGKTVMTTEPKFVPAKAAKIAVSKGAEASVRLVDCVGFAVEGAVGFEEDGAPRLVRTPWQEEPMPFQAAAELGTEKVIKEHSTIGVLMTTDGSVTELPRSAYEAAEERAVRELKALSKPFVIVLNCQNPDNVAALKEELENKYEAPMVALNVEKMSEEDIKQILQKALFEFPVLRIDVKMPQWLQSLSTDNFAVAAMLGKVKEAVAGMEKMRDCFALETLFGEDEDFINPEEILIDLGCGRVEVKIGAKDSLFYRVLSENCQEEIGDDLALMRYVTSLSKGKQLFQKVEEALADADEKGYGIVYPQESEYSLEKPQLVKKSAGYAVQFKAKATGYHIVKVEVNGDICPIIGTKQQGEDFVAETLNAYEEGQDKVWETNIFGKSLRSLVSEELAGKADGVPKEARKKVRRAIGKIVNDGKNNLICIVF